MEVNVDIKHRENTLPEGKVNRPVEKGQGGEQAEKNEQKQGVQEMRMLSSLPTKEKKEWEEGAGKASEIKAELSGMLKPQIITEEQKRKDGVVSPNTTLHIEKKRATFIRRGMEGAKRRAEEPAVATRAPAEQADPQERRSEDGARIVALSHLWEPWRGVADAGRAAGL